MTLKWTLGKQPLSWWQHLLFMTDSTESVNRGRWWVLSKCRCSKVALKQFLFWLMRWRIENNSVKNGSWHHPAASITFFSKYCFARYCEELKKQSWSLSNILSIASKKIGKCTENANIYNCTYVAITLRAKSLLLVGTEWIRRPKWGQSITTQNKLLIRSEASTGW